MSELDQQEAARLDAANHFAVVGVNPDTSRSSSDDCSRHASQQDARASAHSRPAGQAYVVVDTRTGEDIGDIFVSTGAGVDVPADDFTAVGESAVAVDDFTAVGESAVAVDDVPAPPLV